MATSLLDKLGVKKQTVKPERFASDIVKPYQDLGKRLYEEEAFTREVPTQPKTNDFKTQTAETIKQKFGVDVADKSISARLKKSAAELKMTADQRKEYGQLLQDYIQSEALDKPIRAGIVEGFQPLDATRNLREKAPEQTRELEESLGFQGGKVAGTIGQYASMYNLLGPAISGAGAIPTTGGIGAATGTLAPTLTQKLAYGLGSGVAGTVATELAKDVTIGAGLGAIDATSRGDDVAKTVAENILIDIGFNIAGVGIGKAFKSVREAIESAKKAKTPEVVEQVAKTLNVPTSEASKVIDDQIETVATTRMQSDAIGVNLKQQPKFKISDEVVGAQRGQTDAVKTYTENGTVKGSIEYANTPDEIYIKFIDVKEKRKGIGTKLIEDLYKANPNKKINWGGLTEEGAKLKNSIIEKIENPEYKKAINRISEIDAEINRLEGLPDSETIGEIGDYWNALYDEKSLIEKDLFGIDRFIETFRGKQPTIDRPSEFEIRQPKKLTEKLSEPTPFQETEPLLSKFRLDLFGARPDNPVQASLNGNNVRVIGILDEKGVRFAQLDNGTRVDLNELQPSRFVPETGEGALKERGFSENIRTDINRPDELRQAVDADRLFYQQLENKTVLEKAQSIFDRGFEQALNDFRRTSNELRPENVVLSKLIADEAMARGETEIAKEVVSTMAERLTGAGQFSQAARILRESDSPSTILDFVQRELKKLNQQGKKRYGDVRKTLLGGETGWKEIELTKEELDLISQFGKQGTDEQKELLFEQLFDSISKRIPTTKREKLDSFRRMAMLFNPKTHVRNVLGNGIMAGVKGISDRMAAIGEKVFLKPDQFTKSIKSASKKSKEVAEQVFEQNKETLTSGSRWEIFGVKSPFADKKIFETGWLQTLNDVSMKTLEVEDMVFYKHHFVNDLAKYMDARNLSEPTEQAIEYATRRAQEATFREANELANVINKLKGTKYGLIVEAAIPFTKTPANIMKQGLQYSPIGAIQGALQMVSNADPALAIETLSKGLTGTGLSILGFYLAKNGLMRGDYETGKPEGLSQATGNLPNSIITPGGSYTIDWAQPAAIPLFMGVAVAEEMKKNKDAEAMDLAFKAVLAGGDTLFEQTMLRNVKDLFGGYGSTTEKFLQLPADYLAQTFPTVAGQVARTIDPVKRQADYSTLGSGLLTSTQAKTPFISQSLPAKYDLLGQPQTYGQKGLINAFIQFISPGFVGTRTDDPTLLEINRLYESVGTDAIPRTSVKSFTDNKQKYELSNVERSEFQRIMGEYTKKELDKLFATSNYRRMTDNEKAKAIKNINDDGYDKAKEAIIKTRGAK